MRNVRRARVLVPLMLALFIGACESFLDVNDNPNAPENARVDLRIGALVVGMGHSVYYLGPQVWSGEWVQQYSYNRATRNYDEIHRYELQEGTPNSPWQFYYSQIMNEARLIMRETDPEVDGPIHGFAKFIKAWTWLHTTDMWGPIPFTQAFTPEIRDPQYDDQPVVYAAAQQMLEESIADMGRSSVRSLGSGDLLFNGDMSRWIQLARVVQGRHHLRLAYAPWANSQAQAQATLAALQHGFSSNADDVDFQYPGGDGARNPLWMYQNLWHLYKTSEFMLDDVLRAREDPRLPIMVEPARLDAVNNEVVYRAHRNGEPQSPDSTISEIGHFFTAENASLNWASFADQKMMEAEAHLILGNIDAANAAYRLGIRANMEKWGVASADIDTYLAARPHLAQVGNALEEIIREKYVVNFLKIEPWNDWRRTGYPRLEVVPEAYMAQIPARIRTPSTEVDRNVHNVTATGISPGLEGMLYRSDKVWWGGQP